MSDAGSNNGILLVVFISLLIDLLGFTVILPLFPSLLEFYKSNDKGTLYASLETVVTSFRTSIGIPENEDVNPVFFGGMIGSLFSLLQFFNSPFFGALSDVYGRRPLILLSLAGSSVSYVIWSLSDSFLMFLVARFVAGISEANVSISTAIIADLNNPKAKSKGMAIIGIAFSIGFVVGPLVGASFSKIVGSKIGFYIGPALFSLALTLIDIVYVYIKLPETLPVKSRAKSVFSSFSEVSHLLNPFSLFKFSAVRSIQASSSEESKKSLQRLGVVYFLYLFLFSGLEFTLSFLVHRRFNFTRMDQGKMFAFLGIVMALLQGGYIRRKMAGQEKGFAFRGMCLLVPGFIIIGLSTNITMLVIGLLLFAFAAASVVPSISSLTAAHGLESEKGRVMGILRSLGALARATGPITASALYWLMGATPTYVLGGVLLMLPIYLLLKLPKVVPTTDKDK